MKRLFLTAGAALGSMALGLVSATGQNSAGNVLKEARVTQVVKDVKLLANQAEPRPATTSDTVRGNTAVRTGAESRAELTFSDLTIARLGANTIFSFDQGSRTVDLKVDFRAFEIKDGSFVGYGLELDGKHGNLPWIGRM